MPKLAAALALVLAGIPFAGCGPVASGSPQVLTTTTILADMAKQVAGDRLAVGSIVPAGVHVEEYEPRPDDARRMAGAKLVVTNGLGLDIWVEPLLRNAREDTAVVVVMKELPAIDENPHMWFDPSLARRHVEAIRDALIVLDPQGRDAYTSRATAYDEELARLDAELRAKLAVIPTERRKLVTSHDQFTYFANAYDFEVVGFAQPEPGKPTSAGELAELITAVRAAKAPAIFTEAGVSPQLAEAVARETGAKLVTDLPSDSLAEAPANTYVGYMRVLVDKIVAALQ